MARPFGDEELQMHLRITHLMLTWHICVYPLTSIRQLGGTLNSDSLLELTNPPGLG